MTDRMTQLLTDEALAETLSSRWEDFLLLPEAVRLHEVTFSWSPQRMCIELHVRGQTYGCSSERRFQDILLCMQMDAMNGAIAEAAKRRLAQPKPTRISTPLSLEDLGL